VPVPVNDYSEVEYDGIPFNYWPTLCPDPVTARLGAGLAYLSKPLKKDVLIAGNPFAHLRVSSDLPGGFVSVHVLSIPGNYRCARKPEPTETHVISWGSADLRHHAGNFDPRSFPTNRATNIRIDLVDFADRVPAGRRLVVVVSYGEVTGLWFRNTIGRPYYPAVTVFSDGGALASHVVLPILQGTLGGLTPRLDYPPRPFVP
jgi:predicted acyl esterase